MRLPVRAEASEPGIGQAHLPACGRLRDRHRRLSPSKLSVGDIAQGPPPGPRGGCREAPLHHRGVEVDHIDKRAADVRGDRADTHPRQRLAQTRLEGNDQTPDGIGGRQRLGAAAARQLAASSMARRGWTAVAPTARTMAMAWTSRTSTVLTARPSARAGRRL